MLKKIQKKDTYIIQNRIKTSKMYNISILNTFAHLAHISD